MSLRYSIDKGMRPGHWLVYDNVKENYVFRGSYDECHVWIDNKEKENAEFANYNRAG